MKILLKYQNSEYDCGPTSFINALAYLYEREEVPIELIKAIYEYTLDVENSEGIVGKGGTSREKQIELGEYFNKYASETNFKIHAESTKDVTEEILKETINKGGVIVARCFQDVEHYVLITNIIDDMVYIFDSENNVVVGFSLRDIDYMGKERKGIFSKIYRNPNNSIIDMKDTLTWDTKNALRNCNYVIPYLYA